MSEKTMAELAREELNAVIHQINLSNNALLRTLGVSVEGENEGKDLE